MRDMVTLRGPLATQEQLDARLTYLRGLIHARNDVIACSVPVAVLVLAGCTPGAVHPAVVLACLVGELACVLIEDPWGCLDRALAPLSRTLAVLAIMLVGLAILLVVMTDPAPGVAAVLLVLAVLLVGVVVYRRKAWLLAWEVQQSPEVDKVLAHLNGKGAFAPAAAWEQDGCRETRAMLHQALEIECNEAELETLYKAVYLLAYLSGMEGRENEVERLKKELAEAEASADQWHSEAISWKSVARYNQDTGNTLDRMKQELQEAIQRARDAERRAQDAEAELSAWMPEETPESRDEAIRAYVQAGNSYQKAADKFGVSKTRVAQIVKFEA